MLLRFSDPLQTHDIKGRKLKYSLIITTVTAFVVGCGSSSSLEVQNNFPTEQEVTELTQNAGKVELDAPRETAKVSTWELAGPLPSQIGLAKRTPSSRGEVLISKAMQKNPNSVLTESMHCVARETGIFYMKKGKWPFESLENFIEARCGALSFPGVYVYTRDGQATEDEMISANSKAITDFIQKRASTYDHPEFGVASGTVDGKTYLALAYGGRAVKLEPTTMVADESQSVTFVGEMLTDSPDSISVAITQGDFGFAYCEVDTRISLPKFRFSCPTISNDSHAYVSIAVSKKNSKISSFVSLFYVSPSGELLASYQSPATRRAIRAEMERRAQLPEAEEPEAPMPELTNEKTEGAEEGAEADSTSQDGVSDEGSKTASKTLDVEPQPLAPGVETTAGYAESIESIVNSVRQTAGLGPVELSVAQTAENNRIAPAYFAAQQNDDEEVAEKLMMGTIAGWKVKGKVTRGHFFSTYQGKKSPSEFLESYLETPYGRSTLLRPNVGAIAIGTAQAGDGAGVIVSSYQFLERRPFKERWKMLVDDINRQRRQRGLPEAKISKKAIATARRVSAEMEAGETALDDAVSQVQRQVQIKYREPTMGWYFYRFELKDISWPKPVLNERSMRISIAVAPITQEGYPWVVYAIALAYPERD